MPGRIRTIKPEFFHHEQLWDAEKQLGPEYQGLLRLAFVGLWCQCDREGRFKWKPRALKVETLPYDDVDFETIIDALVRGGWVQIYEVDGQEYGLVPTFPTNQAINHRERASQIPPPPEVVEDDRPLLSRVPHACPTRPGGKGREGKGREGKGREVCTGDSRVIDASHTVPTVGPEFPTKPGAKGKETSWRCPKKLFDAFVEGYPGVDIEAELRKAYAWCVANQSEQKTARGMPGFLNRWISSSVNRGRASPAGRNSTKFEPKRLEG
jgi:hypothetical protein